MHIALALIREYTPGSLFALLFGDNDRSSLFALLPGTGATE
jgi:hypothetical protein